MSADLRRRPVVTGLGVIAPNGLGTADFWASTCAGRSAIGPVTRFDAAHYPSRLAGEVAGFRAEDHLPSRLLTQTDHMTRLALVAADWALADAEVRPDTLDPLEKGVITAASAGGFEFGQRELERLWSQGSEYVSAYQSFAWFYAVNTGQISIRQQLKGPSGVLVTDQAGGLDAIAQARRQLRRGSRLIVSGGVDGSICPWGWVCQLAAGRLSTSDDPAAAYLPFDRRAAGYVPAEGGAILVLEDPDLARERGGPGAYGEIAGYAATFDPAPGSGREPTLRRTIETALADADTAAADVDVVFCDAAALPELDRVEATAVVSVFGEYGVPVTAPKTMTGRMCAGAAAVDVAAALLAIRDGIIPPTAHVEPDDNLYLDLVVNRARRASVHTAVVIARGHGGFNSVLVLRATAATARRSDYAAPGTVGGGHMRQTIALDDLRRILREGAGTEDGANLDGDILDTEFASLGYDSLALMETASRISREFGIPIDDDALFQAKTPRQLLDLVNAG